MEKTILIVDDAAPVRELLASALSKRGYSVTTAESAQAALDKLQENYYHVMFVDLHMPDMSGVELCEKIRRLPAVIYVRHDRICVDFCPDRMPRSRFR